MPASEKPEELGETGASSSLSGTGCVESEAETSHGVVLGAIGTGDAAQDDPRESAVEAGIKVGWEDLAEAECDAIEADAEATSLQNPSSSIDDLNDGEDDGPGETALQFREIEDEDIQGFVDPAKADQLDEDPSDLLSTSASTDSDRDLDFGISDYDPGARHRPWEFESEDVVVPPRARQKAAAIVAKMHGIVRQADVQALLDYLSELFTSLPHASTFRAFSAAVDQGMTPEELDAMVSLREVWLERPEWWVGRRFDKMQWSTRVHTLRHGRSALTWALALRICRIRSDYAVEDMIDESWFEDWLALSPQDRGYRYFPMYVEIRVARLEAAPPRYRMCLDRADGDCRELQDDLAWHKHGYWWWYRSR
ncbi:hypothetical protein FHP25_32650 [Vineibacter terrae]|uniref:Uncharacterized protein n=1 Tax=Vineibacter terrae TaxID=2586908 RepID=A0A5C8PAS1_9HYPH|nr:hypothetical protein [Vineibacter terrae]TXL70871.1 hypothetical protein FHP25_32650 [Vineibacter terrae]